MIQQSHLTAWQSYAPWPKRSQIEKIYVSPAA